MVQIDDGGKNGPVRVSNTNRLNVSARAASRQYYESRDEGQVYTASFEDAGAVADEETAYIQNTSTDKDMIIDSVFIGTDILSIWRVKFVTGTATGTVVTPTNLNKTSSNAAAANARGGTAGVGSTVDAGDICFVYVPVGSSGMYNSNESLRLGQNDAIAVECETSSDAKITITFHYDSE